MPREYQSVVTRKGQVTIPVEIRRALQLDEGDTVAFTLQGDEIRLKAVEGVVARTAGMFRDAGPGAGERSLPAESERELAERAVAEESVSRAE